MSQHAILLHNRNGWLSDMKLNVIVFPPLTSGSRPVILRNALESDGRGHRKVVDCALLADRFQVPASTNTLRCRIARSVQRSRSASFGSTKLRS
jgi:hypothetical protein